MSTYKITNITNTAGKRDFKFNSELSIDYVDNMVKKVIAIKPGNSIYLNVQSLPLSVHRLRVKGLITVTEVSPAELTKLIEEAKPKTKAKAKTTIKEDEAPKKSGRKKKEEE